MAYSIFALKAYLINYTLIIVDNNFKLAQVSRGLAFFQGCRHLIMFSSYRNCKSGKVIYLSIPNVSFKSL